MRSTNLVLARRLKEKIEGVLSHCRGPFGTSLLEGIDYNISVNKRPAFGFRHDNVVFLGIRAAFPANT